MLKKLIDDFSARKQQSLIKMKKGSLSRDDFLAEVSAFVSQNYELDPEKEKELVVMFEQYIFGYSRISPLIDDEEISDIRIISFDNIRVKRKGKRMDAGICFQSEQ